LEAIRLRGYKAWKLGEFFWGKIYETQRGCSKSQKKKGLGHRAQGEIKYRQAARKLDKFF
jgi:hypothetical protein